MACATGRYHTITLSNDGTPHSFGRNNDGALGLGHNNYVSLPTPIPNLPQINMISCGAYFTVCVDYEGFIWSFGENNCGSEHILIITNDSNLWSWGGNSNGQLCHGDKEDHPIPLRLIDRSKPQKTSFSNISKISAGWGFSLFQNNKEEIIACGFNQYGQCGLGHFNSPQITPILIPNAIPNNFVQLVCGCYNNLLNFQFNLPTFIPNLPSNIIQFVCGYHHSLFLDSEGNVFSVGDNVHGQLGLGHNRNQNVLNKIPNIPPIKIISCVRSSSYLIDFEGNLWSFGFNNFGQLAHGDNTHINTPKIVNSLNNIQQISYGSCGEHFFAKSSQNQIFATGSNNYGQLGTGDTQSLSIPKELNSQYSTIWRDEFYTRAKSARK